MSDVGQIYRGKARIFLDIEDQEWLRSCQNNVARTGIMSSLCGMNPNGQNLHI